MPIELKKVCVPVDFSEQSKHSLKYGVALAKQFGAELHMIHVVQDIAPTVPEPGLAILPTEEIMRSLEKGAIEGLDKILPPEWGEGLKVYREVRHGAPHYEICHYAKDVKIDLLVVATHGRTGIAHFLLGSVAERIVRTAPCPVLTVRHPENEFVT